MSSWHSSTPARGRSSTRRGCPSHLGSVALPSAELARAQAAYARMRAIRRRVSTGVAVAGLFPWLAVLAPQLPAPSLLRAGLALWAVLLATLAGTRYAEWRLACAARRREKT
jgi:hypothetical protein